MAADAAAGAVRMLLAAEGGHAGCNGSELDDVYLVERLLKDRYIRGTK